MRKLFVVVATLLVFSIAALAEDMVRVPFVNDVYSIEMPGDWDVEQSEDGIVTIKPEDSLSSIIICPPNPHVEGELEGYVGAYLAGIFATYGEGEIINQAEGDFEGYPTYAVLFTFETREVDFTGALSAIDFDGWAVLCLAMGPSDEMEEFMEVASEVMNSFEIDEEALEENEELLAELGEKAIEELHEMIN